MSEILDNFVKNRFKNLTGQPVTPGNMGDAKALARDLGNVLFALHKLDTQAAPKPSFENNFAGADLELFEAEFDETLKKYSKLVPAEFLHEKFQKALKTPFDKPAVWVHGSFLPKNILVAEAKLVSVQAFDKAVAGDPACDLAVAWLLFDRKARKIFFSAADASPADIDRARLYAVRNALNLYHSQDIDELIQSRDSLTEILKDYDFSGGVDSFDTGISAKEEDVDFQAGGLFGK